MKILYKDIYYAFISDNLTFHIFNGIVYWKRIGSYGRLKSWYNNNASDFISKHICSDYLEII